MLSNVQHVLTDLLHAAEPFWEANSFSGSQEILQILWNPKFHYRIIKCRHLRLSWASSIQSILPYDTSWRSILILYSHLLLGFPSDIFPSGFATKTLYTPHPSPITATCPTNRILLVSHTKTDAGSSVISSDLKHRANDLRDGLSSYSNRRDQSGLNGCCTAMWKANAKNTTLSIFLDRLIPKSQIPYTCEMLHLETKQTKKYTVTKN